MKIPTLASALLLSLAGAAPAQTVGVPAGTYAADAAHTNVLWSVNHFGLSNYVGRFEGIDATLELDPANPANSKLVATVDPASVSTNDAAAGKDFDTEIESDMFLDAAKFPTIEFRSTAIELTGADTGTVTGDLTFHGVTKPVTLDVKLNAALNPHPMSQKPTVGFSAKGTIKRSDFGVTALVGPVSDEVALTIETEFVAK